MLACLREDWADDRLHEIPILSPYIEEKLASTRCEGIRQGYSWTERHPTNETTTSRQPSRQARRPLNPLPENETNT